VWDLFGFRCCVGYVSAVSMRCVFCVSVMLISCFPFLYMIINKFVNVGVS